MATRAKPKPSAKGKVSGTKPIGAKKRGKLEVNCFLPDTWGHAMFNKKTGVYPLTDEDMQQCYLRVYGSDMFKSKPFDTCFASDVRVAVEERCPYWIRLVQMIEHELALTARMAGKILHANFAPNSSVDKAFVAFSIMVDTYTARAPERADPLWRPGLVKALSGRMISANCAFNSKNYNLFRHDTKEGGQHLIKLCKALKVGGLDSDAGDSGKTWAARLNLRLQRAGVTNGDIASMNTGQLMGNAEKKGFLYAEEAMIVARRRIALAKANAKERARVNALAKAAGGRISTGEPSGLDRFLKPPDLGRQQSSATEMSAWSQGTTASPRSQFDGSNSDRAEGNRTEGDDFGDQFQGNPDHAPPVGFARRMFHGASLESIREDTKNATKWGVPGLKALQLDMTSGNGSWVQVLGYKLDGKMVTYVMQEMPYTAQDRQQPSFGWTPYQLAGAFLAAEMQFGRLPPPAVLGSVQNQQERSQTQQLIDGLTASIVGASKRQKTDPEGGWSDDLQAIFEQIEKHSGTSAESLAAIMSLTDGKEILTLIRWLSRCKSFEAVERKMPRHASILERRINSYNDTWKTSWTVLTVVRLWSFNWKLVTEDDLVASMVAGQATAAESEEMGVTVDSSGQFVIKQVAKGAKAKGGFTSCQVIKDIWVHLHNLFRMGFGITGAHALVPPLETLSEAVDAPNVVQGEAAEDAMAAVPARCARRFLHLRHAIEHQPGDGSPRRVRAVLA